MSDLVCITGTEESHYLNLNTLGRWQGFTWTGLELQDDGSLTLIRLPALEGDAPAGLAALTVVDAPAGLVVTPDGTVYFTDPARHRVLMILACPETAQDEPECEARKPAAACAGDRPPAFILPGEHDQPWNPVPCLGGQGDAGTQFILPRGLAYHPLRHALIVADSGGHRLQLFNPETYTLLDIWGRPDGQPSDEPGRFNQPYSLAVDPDGHVYVVDYGNRRVQKFDPWGRVLPDFWQQLEASLHGEGYVFVQPSEVTVGSAGGAVEVYVLDEDLGLVFVFDAAGRLLRLPFGLGILERPAALAAADGVVYVGDNARRRIFQFSRTGEFAGAALQYEGPVTALALDRRGSLLVLPGADFAPLRLAARGGFSSRGALWGGPFHNPGQIPQEWHRVQAALNGLRDGAHFRLFLYASASEDPNPVLQPPANPPWSGSVVDALDCLVKDPQAPACDDRWVRLPLDAAEGVIQATQTRNVHPGQWKYLSYVWVGAEFSGEGQSSPVLSQIRVDFDHETYLHYLPPLYMEEDRSRRFLGRYLTLVESMFDNVENGIRSLPELFDPQAAPPDFLGWLGGWSGFELEEDWALAKKRSAIAEAFALHGQRGTLGGLQAAVKLFTGVVVGIEEPIQQTGWWALPAEEGRQPEVEMSVLGFNTYLLPAEADGAIAGTTATVDSSNLISGVEFGAPLFSDVAYRFNVRMYRGASYSEQAREAVAAVLEIEKPAHTLYHICSIEPRMRIGFQARLGVDTIVAGLQVPSALERQAVSGDGLLLGGDPPGRLDHSGRIGQQTRLGG